MKRDHSLPGGLPGRSRRKSLNKVTYEAHSWRMRKGAEGIVKK